MKTKKLRFLSALLALAMLFTLLPTAAFADTGIVASGTCGAEGDGSNLTWELDSDGTLTISGTGEMADYVDNFSTYRSTAPWAEEQVTQVVINEGVTRIGNCAFWALPSIISVSIPDGVKSIGEFAFSGWYSGGVPATQIEKIEIPASVTDIGRQAFGNCEKLKTISFEADSKLVKIGYAAFSNCSKLSEVTIPAGVTNIEAYAFYLCSGLQSVTFAPNSQLETIELGVFDYCPALNTIYCESALKEKLSGVIDETKVKIIVTHWNVSFVTDDDTTTKLVENNKTVEKPTTDPTKEDYIFAGWYTKDASGNWADEPFDFDTPITDDVTLYARWGVEATPIGPATRLYPITIDYGTAYNADGDPIEKAAEGEEVTIKAASFDADMVFERWEVRKGDVTLANDHAAETTFTMPAGEVHLEAMPKVQNDDSSWDTATVVTGAAIGAGTAILAYHIGTELYAEQVLGKGVPVPRTRAEVALLAWELAGKPEVDASLSETEQAQRWALESGLMQNKKEGSFHGEKEMNKLKALRVLDKAKG